MKSKSAIATVLLIACAVGLSIAYAFLPHRVKLDDPNFVITKQLKPKITNGIPPWRIEYDITLTYVGEEPIYIKTVGSNVQLLSDGPISRFGKYILYYPGDGYTSHINDSLAKSGVPFKYNQLEVSQDANGLPNYRVTGEAQTIQIDF